jgi:hypothetical protein
MSDLFMPVFHIHVCCAADDNGEVWHVMRLEQTEAALPRSSATVSCALLANATTSAHPRISICNASWLHARAGQ